MNVRQNKSSVFLKSMNLGSLPSSCIFDLEKSLDLSRCVVFPGFCDVHVHLREPGFSYKETIQTGTRAAARGGYTDVCTMPNLNPVPDSLEHLLPQQQLIRQNAVIGVHPYGAITQNQAGKVLSDMEALAPFVVGFSDDGKGVQDEHRMRQAMEKAAQLGKILVAHCEDESLLSGGCIHDGAYAKAHGYAGISSQSEWVPLQRDLELVRQTGCAYHACHLSTKESVELIRKAKAEGLNVSCETAPHYLLLCEEELQEDGRFKMNPPLRTAEDRQALVEGLADGTVDMVATDHAPHAAEEKAKGLKGSSMGVVGLETAFPVLYTGLVKTGKLSLERLIEALSLAPRTRFGLQAKDDFCLWQLEDSYVIQPQEFESMGKSTPFEGWTVFGRCAATIKGGNVVWQQK